MVRGILIGAALLAATTGGVARAQDAASNAAPSGAATSPEPHASGVSFLDERPLTVSLTDLAPAEGLSVAVRNNENSPQAISVRIVGLEQAKDPDVRAAFGDFTTEDPIAAGEATIARVPLTLDGDIDPDTYSAVIVAFGSRGPVARRELTIDATAPAPAPPDDKVAADKSVSGVSAKTVSTLKVTGTNYLPSLLAPFSAALVAIAILGVVVLWAAWSLLGNSQAAGIAVLVVVAGGLGGISLFQRDESRPRSAHAISVRPVPVTDVASGTNIGTAQNDVGQLISLQARGGRIWPNGLNRAGAYTGKFDLTPGEDGGDGDTTVNVRDWWPWAFLTLALGLTLASYLRRWFTVQRAAGQVNLVLSRAQLTLGTSDFRFDRQATDGLTFSISETMRQRIERVKELIAVPDLTTAATAAAALEKYVVALAKARLKVIDLSNREQAIRKGWKSQPFGVEEHEIVVAERFQELKRRLQSFDQGPVEDDESATVTLSDLQTEIDAQLSRAMVISRLQPIAIDLLDEAQKHGGKDWNDLAQKIHAHGAALLAQPELDKPDDLQATSTALWAEVRKKRGDEEEPPHRISTKLPSMAALQARSVVVIDDLDPGDMATGEFEVDISYKVLSPLEPADDAVHIGDAVTIEVSVTGTAKDADELEIDPGDGSGPRIVCIPAKHPRVISVLAEYDTSGDFEVTVVKRGQSNRLARRSIFVSSSTRVEALRARLRQTDESMQRIAFAVAVGSGMAALYFTDATWGQPLDYLTALLWGGAAGEGVQLVSSLVQGKLPDAA